MPFFKRAQPKEVPAVICQAKLDETSDMLEKREAVLMKKIDLELVKAKASSASKNKQQALMALKRKKTYEEQLTKMYAQRTNLDLLRAKMEETTMNMVILEAQKSTAETLKKQMISLNIDNVDNTMENVRETMEKANDISLALATPLDGDLYDEDELLEELDNLDQGELDDELAQIVPVPVQTIRAPAIKPAQRTPQSAIDDAVLDELDQLLA